MYENFSLIRRLSQIGTRICTSLSGILVGTDQAGNRYFRARHTAAGERGRRWVIYAGEPEASKVPPEWHIWLHHIAAAPLATQDSFHQPWQKPHQPNLTGTEAAYLPPGHILEGGRRAKATGDYQAWNPDD